MEYKGMDVSSYQGDIDWAKVKSAGIDFVMIRAGFGKTADSKCIQNIRGALNHQIQVGLYWFSYAVNEREAEEEAARLIETAHGWKISYPLAFDYEDASVRYAADNGVTVTKTLATAMADAFCKAVAAAGYTPMVYSNPDFLTRYIDFSSLGEDCRLWLAEWGVSKPSYAASIWQYVSGGRVDGVPAAVDLDVSYESYSKECCPIRYQTLEEIPAALRAETEILINSGALKGSGQGLNVTEDMLRSMIVAMRYTDIKTAE